MIRSIILSLSCIFTTLAFSYDEEAKEEMTLSTPEQHVSLSSDPQFLIGGVISPLSGSPILRQTDFTVKGAQEISLTRTYLAPFMPTEFATEEENRQEWEKYYLYQHVARHYKGWQFYPHLKLQLNPDTKELLLTDRRGSTFCFAFKGPEMTDAAFEGKAYGISNCVGEELSGAYDPRNIQISYKGKKIIVNGADATKRIYRLEGWDSTTAQLYLLEKEILPNGKVLKYHYEKRQPVLIESLDPKERHVYASIQIKGSPLQSKVRFQSSSGHHANYQYERRPLHIQASKKIERWHRSEQISQEFHFLCPPILTKVSSSNFWQERAEYCGRFLFGDYEGKEHHFRIVNRGYGEINQDYRTHQFFLPVGENGDFECVYQLSYQPPIAGKKEGTTTVEASDGTSTVYHFNKNLLTSKIEYFAADGTLQKEKNFTWDKQNWLRNIEVRDGQGELFYKRAFKYDQFGNPIQETFTGDLTGSGEKKSIWTERPFSDDGKNLLLSEEREDGKKTLLTYLKGTNLLTSKLIQDQNGILSEEYWQYDNCHNLIEKISDQRKTSYILRQEAPFLHMPEWVIETYLEEGIEQPLTKTHLTYDRWGNVCQEELYDAEGQLAYTIQRSYNERSDLLSETNRIGQEATYAYDMKGHKKAEANFSKSIHKRYEYDKRGRLCKVIAKGDDQNCRTQTNQYDHHDRLIEKRDSFENSARYQYDPLVNKVIETEQPPITSIDGLEEVKTHSTYDPFGREITHTDANGNRTTYSYNVYGSVSQVIHPNGGVEQFRYAKNGHLASHTDPDGETIKYKRDSFGRVLQKRYIGKEGSAVAEENYTYMGKQLIAEKDKEHNLKQYSYDGAGRKIREESCGRVKEFAYDPLGRLSTIYQHCDSDALVIHYERDLEDRILTEKRTDLSGNILYKIVFSYDRDGNQTSTIRYINGEESVDTVAYDTFKRPILHQDPQGNTTHTTYHENHLNSLGQKVLQIKIVEPNGIQTTKTYDAHHRNVKTVKQNPCGQILACNENTYDPHGNLILYRDHLYESGTYQSTQAIHYTYTSSHRIKNYTRGYGSQDMRETDYRYSPAGKIEKKIRPDGTSLSYRYNPLGYLARIDSSDGAIAHAFTYNRLGDLLEAVDEKQNLIVTRKVDPFGNILSEEQPHKATVTKTYDPFNRPLTLTLQNSTQIRYYYDPLYLREIETDSYSHTFEEYDLAGNLIQEQLIANLGTIAHSYDTRGLKTDIQSPYFLQNCQYNSIQNLISNSTDQATSHYQYDETGQLIDEGSVTYTNDSVHNRKQKSGNRYIHNALNELLCDEKNSYAYDLRGNQVLKKTNSQQLWMDYDPLDRLIRAKTEQQKIEFIYDPLGRRLAKIISKQSERGWEESSREYYLYDGNEEIGSFKNPDILETFRVQSSDPLPKTVAIEIQGKAYAPLSDIQGNIRRLIDIQTKKLAALYDFTPFGERVQAKTQGRLQNPWQYASKRYDPHLALINFGKRDYDPRIGRWITTDPAGFIDGANLYQYLFNNPFKYVDPDGEFIFIPVLIWGATAAVPALTTLGTSLIAGLATGAIAYGSYKLIEHSCRQGHAPGTAWDLPSRVTYQEANRESLSRLQRKKKGGIDPNPKQPESLKENPDWRETTHQEQVKAGHREFENIKTGEKIRFDKGDPEKPGHRAYDHHHHLKPNPKGGYDYLDNRGNIVREGSDASHLYNPENVWWE